jgi:hypothetical protein
MAKKTTVTVSITFEDDKDFKMHMGIVREKVNAFLKHPQEDLKSGEEITGWSSHTYSIETTEE